jgi:hypothetical protein
MVVKHYIDNLATFYNQHPNIYDFMEKIKLIQTYKYLKIRAASRPLLLSTAEKGNLEQMRNIQRQYRNDEIIRKEYVKLMVYRAQPITNM